MPKPEDVIGPAAVLALQDAGYTLVPPKEPARIVTFEESQTRFEKHILRVMGMGSREGTIPSSVLIAADDWLVKTVNRRIIDGLRLHHVPGYVHTHDRPRPTTDTALLTDLLRLFCGEEK